MKIGLYEKSTRFERSLTETQKENAWRYDECRYEPSGEFDLTLSRWPLHDRHWKDTAKRKLEDRLTDIVVEIVQSTEVVKLENDRREWERIAHLEGQRLDTERIERNIDENRRREELENHASIWRRPCELRSFFLECGARILGQHGSDSEILSAPWLR